MTRLGINPARGKFSDYRPTRVTVVVLTYIPDQTGYFEQRLQVLQLTLASLQAHTTLPHDLLVFDNGSCSVVVDYLHSLQQAGQINYLLLSQQNIGKIGALRLAFSTAPGKVIAYNDDDILFYPGWLEAHLQILEHFPKAGMVSGLPVRDASRHAHNSLDRLVKQGIPDLSIAYERRIPDEWETDWAISTGRDPQAHLEATREHKDLVLRVAVKPESAGSERSDDFCEVIGSANHFQFVGFKQVLLQALPDEWSGKLMGHMVELDQAIDDLGYLRLSTANRYTRHLGNALSEAVIHEAQALGLQTSSFTPSSTTTSRQSKKRRWLLRIPGSRRVLSALYNRLFNILYR